jgi:hypothetical protein
MKTIITITFIILSIVSNAQVGKIVKKMEKADFEKAKEIAQKTLSENSDDPGANLLMGWMFFDEKDYFKAYKYMMAFKKNESTLTAEDKEDLNAYMDIKMMKMRKKPFDERVEKLYSDIEETTINYVREQLDPALAKEFIEMFPESPFLENTKHIRNHYAYEKAVKEGTVDALIKFQKEYPEAAQIEKAQERIYELKFEEAKTSKSLDAFNEFIEKYPLAKQRTEALLMRNQLAFDKAKAANSLEAIKTFIRDYPNALQLGDAKKLKQKLVFEKAKQINTIEAYTEFVKEYPFGKYYVDIFNLKAKALGQRIAEKSQVKDYAYALAFDYSQTKDRFNAAAIDNQGNIYLAGTIQLDTAPLQDVWLLKLDPTGKMIWNKQFGSPANDHINELYLEDDGSLLGIGIYGATDTTAGQGWMLSVAADGKKQWMKLLNDMYPLTSVKSGKNVLVGGHKTDSLKSMYLVKYDSEADKLYTRTYSLPGSIRSINAHSTDGQIFSGKNWVVHIDELGYIQQDEILDSSLIVLDIIEKEGVIYAAGVNDDFNLFLWDSQNKNVTQTTQNVKKLKYLPNTNLIVQGSNNTIMELTNAGGFVKDVAKYADDFKLTDNYLFFSSIGSILESNITVIKTK